MKNTEEHFIKCIKEGINAWSAAGKILVAMLKHNPNIKTKLRQNHPELSISILNKLEAVGRGHLKPELLLSDAPPYKAARRLPVSDQEFLLKQKAVPLVIYTESGIDEISANFDSLTAKQSNQVFAKDHIRTPAEQRLLLEEKRKQVARDWGFENGMVVFKRGAKMSVQQLTAIIQEVATRGGQAA